MQTYYFVDNQHALPAIIAGLINNDIPLITCAHLRIGASYVDEMLRGQLTTAKIHAFIHTSKQRAIGRIAEAAARKLFPNSQKITKASGQLPFICAAPDLSLPNAIIEVKSTTKNVDFKLTADVLMQVVISMQVFEVEKAVLLAYQTIGNTTILKKKFLIKKEVNIFNEEFVKYATYGYVSYLSSLQYFLNKPQDQQQKELACEFLQEYSKKDNRSFKIGRYSCSRLCFAVFPFMDYHFATGVRLKKTDKVWKYQEAKTKAISDCLPSLKAKFEAINEKFCNTEDYGREDSIYSNYFTSFKSMDPTEYKKIYNMSESIAKTNETEFEELPSTPQVISLSIGQQELDKILSVYSEFKSNTSFDEKNFLN